MVGSGSSNDSWAGSATDFFAVIKAADFSNDEIVFVDIAFADLSELSEVNTLFAELFPEGKRPARTIYQAAALPFGSKVKVMGTAVKDESDQQT